MEMIQPEQYLTIFHVMDYPTGKIVNLEEEQLHILNWTTEVMVS